MKKITLLVITLLSSVFVYNQVPDSWTQKADFGGTARDGAVGFSIGSKGYIGTGSDKKDFWEYDYVSNAWTQKADFGGGNRIDAVGFGIGNKGYIGTGYSSNIYRADFWEYDPVSNIWTRKADFGGGARYRAAGFSILNKGYVGIGNANPFTGDYKLDFWEYDPASNVWVRKANFPGSSRFNSANFTIGNKGFVGTGHYFFSDDDITISKYYSDFWEYDPVADTWTRKADFAGGNRADAVGLSINDKGYIGTGYDEKSNANAKDFWKYDPVANSWTQKADFGGGSRSSAVGFSINNNGFVGTGSNQKDFWQYTPSTDTIIASCQPPAQPNVPFISYNHAFLNWKLPANPVNGFDIVYHVIGSTRIHKRHVTGNTNHIAVGNLLSNTIYRWKIRSDCTADTTEWIDGPEFTTTSLAVSSLNAAAVKSNDVSVRVMPNPNKGNFTIQMQLPAKAGLTTLTVYNSFGIKVWQQNAGILSGLVNRNIELKSELPAGVYVLMIRQGDTRLKQKFVVTE